MWQKLSSILFIIFLLELFACSNEKSDTSTANLSSGKNSTIPASEFPSSPGATLKRFLEAISNKDAQWCEKYIRAINERDPKRSPNEPPLTDGQIKNLVKAITDAPQLKAKPISFIINRETTEGDRSTVSLTVNRSDSTSETKDFTLTRAGGVWIVGDLNLKRSSVNRPEESDPTPEPRAPDDLQIEAETFWSRYVANCEGGRYFMKLSGGRFLELKGYLVEGDYESVTDADRLNGIESKGTTRITASAHRYYYDSRWHDWQSGLPSTETVFDATFQKTSQGEWSFRGTGYFNDYAQKINCSEVP